MPLRLLIAAVLAACFAGEAKAADDPLVNACVAGAQGLWFEPLRVVHTDRVFRHVSVTLEPGMLHSKKTVVDCYFRDESSSDLELERGTINLDDKGAYDATSDLNVEIWYSIHPASK